MSRVLYFTFPRPIENIEASWDAHRPKYWSHLSLESALQGRKVVYDNVDFAQEKHTEKTMVSYSQVDELSDYSEDDAMYSNPPLSAHEACQPCNIATTELLRSQLVFPRRQDSYIESRNLVKRPDLKATSFLRYVQNEQAMDLGTMMANLKTYSWEKTKCEEQIPNDVFLLTYLRNIYHRCSKTSPRNDGSFGLSIMNPYSILPRRLWDLHSNRVVEVKVFAKVDGAKVIPRMPGSYIAISHSWTEDMQLWLTPINHYQWVVPLPKGTTFEQIRWEALRAGSHYCWLDVLCLRQRTMEEVDGKQQEVNKEQRRNEWSIDVPTIGNVYRQATKVLRYFNGLGREFKLTGWDDTRHWINRAWTLQEMRAEHLMVNACVPEIMPFPLHELVKVGGRQLPMYDVLTPLARMVDAAEVEVDVQGLWLQQLVVWGDIKFRRKTGLTDEGKWSFLKAAFLWTVLRSASSAWCYQQHDTMLRALWGVLYRMLLNSLFCLVMVGLMAAHLGGDLSSIISIPYWKPISYAVLCLWVCRIAMCGMNSIVGDMSNVGWLVLFYCGLPLVVIRYGNLLLRVQFASIGAGSRLLLLWPFSGIPFLFLLPELFIQAAYHSHSRAPLAWIILSIAIPALFCWIASFSASGTAGRLLRSSFRTALRPPRYCSILILANEITRREATNPHDKVVGLAYLMRCSSLPVYTEEEDIETLWLRLVAHLPFPAQLELLFNFPSNRNGKGLKAYSDVVRGSWIPTWGQISSRRTEPGRELLLPTWPPKWLQVFGAPAPVRTYDPNSHAILLPSCARILLIDSITWNANSRSYMVEVTKDRTGKEALGPFYNSYEQEFDDEHEYQHIHSSKSKAYVFILHVYDCEAAPISGVVAELLYPSSSKHWKKWRSAGLGVWYNEGFLKLDSELEPEVERSCIGVFGLTRAEARETFVVRKLGTLITDRPGSIGSTHYDLANNSVINAPVLFL